MLQKDSGIQRFKEGRINRPKYYFNKKLKLQKNFFNFQSNSVTNRSCQDEGLDDENHTALPKGIGIRAQTMRMALIFAEDLKMAQLLLKDGLSIVNFQRSKKMHKRSNVTSLFHTIPLFSLSLQHHISNLHCS